MLAHARNTALLALLVIPAGYAQTPADQQVQPSKPGRIVSTLVIGTAEPVAADIDAQGDTLPDGPPATPEVSLTPDELDRLVAELGSSDYQTRLEATRTLAGLSTELIDGLAGVYASSDDLEVKLRLREIVERRFMWDHLLGRHGFLGIQMSRPLPTADLGALLAPGAEAVLVTRILPGQAAEMAGVRTKDLIFELNGEPIAASLDLQGFGQQISSAGAGGVVRLSILRGKQRLDLEVQLRHRVREHYWSPPYRDQPQPYWDRLVAAARGFERYWRVHFLAPCGETSASEPRGRE
ncbi:MAG: PDZ domain-containing protein [Planctomycetes bacterium]|nr:PDZ domain-containing protein [Planctomycetota bacterium]